MRGKKIISLLLVAVLSMSVVSNVSASEVEKKQNEITDAKKKGEQLKENKKQAEVEKKKIAEQLNKVLGEVADLEQQINDKQEEIDIIEEKLIQAELAENDQYENMKKRIKYMYEAGNTQFVEILCRSEDFSSFVNNAEYISTISDYDRDMLKKYQAAVKAVETQQKQVEEEYKKLEGMQDDLIKKQNEVQAMLDSKSAEIVSLINDISANADEVKKLEAAKKAAEEAERKKREAEEARKAAEEAKRAAEAAKKAETSAASSEESTASSAGEAVVSGNGTLSHPCPGYSRISSTFGYRKAPLAGASTYHKGIDFAASSGTSIYAASGGTVTTARYSGNAGNMVVINHGNGMSTYYMHCSRIYVSAGQRVEKGQNIAAVGSTGNSTGPHLHFQVVVNGTAVNPLKYL